MSAAAERDLEQEAWKLYDAAIKKEELGAAQKTLEFIERIRGLVEPVKGTGQDGGSVPTGDESLRKALKAVNAGK